MHRLDELGIDHDRSRVLYHSFDGDMGLSQLFRTATLPLGKTFALRRTPKDIDSATRARDDERLIVFGYHGAYEDIKEVAERLDGGAIRRVADAAGLGFDLIGHYVAYDTSAGILYLEPEVYIVSEAERQDPSLLRLALMRPPYQLLFEKGPTAVSHTRLLTLSLRKDACVQSNYSNPALLVQMRDEYRTDMARARNGKSRGA